MGHGSPAFTKKQYGHLFDGAQKMREARAGMDARFGRMLEGFASRDLSSPVADEVSKVAVLPGLAVGGD
jgi:hypothetical protein